MNDNNRCPMSGRHRWSTHLIVSFLLLIVSTITTVQAIPIDNSLVGAELIKKCVTGKTLDLVIIMDGSGSIGDDTFELQKSFLVSLIDKFDISPNGTRIAVIQYAEFPQLEIAFTDATVDVGKLQWTMQRIRYLGGTTNTGMALQFANDRVFTKEARGGDVPKVALVITDGQSQDDVTESAQRLRDSHVLMFAIGVTDLIDVHELHTITGGPHGVFTVESFAQLDDRFADQITWQMCKNEFRAGVPEIVCASDRIGVQASTRNPFEGYVFVMDHFHQNECRADPYHFTDSRRISLTVPFNACNVHRWRSLNPRGIFVEMTVVFMFHTLFMTKVDQMVKVQCFYMEADKTVSVPLEVSMITTRIAEETYPMPVCYYSLRSDSPNGPIIQFAAIGDKVFHRWECIESENRDTFGMLVHSCYVDDGHGNTVNLIDSNGCGLDAVLLRTPDYDLTSLRLATKDYHVFKYADRAILQFQCQITLCIKYDNGCANITPPPATCQRVTNYSLAATNITRQRRSMFDDDRRMTTLDVFTGPVQVVITTASSHSSSSEQCISHNTMILIICQLTAIYILVTIISIIIIITIRLWSKRR